MNNEISLQWEQLNLIQRKFLKELPWYLANVPVKEACAPSQVFVLEIPCL